MKPAIRIVSDGTAHNTRFYDTRTGREIEALRNACTGFCICHHAGELPKALIEVLPEFEMVCEPKLVHPFDQMVERANARGCSR